MPKSQKVYYAVLRGRKPGIYDKVEDATAQTIGFSRGYFRKFKTLKNAEDFMREINYKNEVGDPASTQLYSKKSNINYQKPQSLHFYAVHRGRKPGVYTSWELCSLQVINFPDVAYRRCHNLEEAIEYVRSGQIKARPKRTIMSPQSSNLNLSKRRKLDEVGTYVSTVDETAVVFTSGMTSGRGKEQTAGMGVYWGPQHPFNTSKRITGIQTLTRARIYAIVHALYQVRKIKVRKVTLYTDCQCLYSIMRKITQVKTNNWLNARTIFTDNTDLFMALDSAHQGLNVEFVKVGNKATYKFMEANKLAIIGANLYCRPENISEFNCAICNFSNSVPMGILNEVPKLKTQPSSKANIQTMETKCISNNNIPFLEYSSSFKENTKLLIPSTAIIKSDTEIVKQNTEHLIPSSEIVNSYKERIKQNTEQLISSSEINGKSTIKENTELLISSPEIGKSDKEIVKQNTVQLIPSSKIVKSENVQLIVPKTELLDDEFVNVFIDGSSFISDCIRAGIGIYWSPHNVLNISLRLPGRQSNNRAEIWAAIHALHQAKKINIKKVRVYTDSEFLIKGITTYIEQVKQNNWKGNGGIPTIYEEDFKALDEARIGLTVDWHIVDSKSFPEFVEAEKLAVAGCKKIAIETVILE